MYSDLVFPSSLLQHELKTVFSTRQAAQLLKQQIAFQHEESRLKLNSGLDLKQLW